MLPPWVCSIFPGRARIDARCSCPDPACAWCRDQHDLEVLLPRCAFRHHPVSQHAHHRGRALALQQAIVEQLPADPRWRSCRPGRQVAVFSTPGAGRFYPGSSPPHRGDLAAAVF